MTHSLEKVHRFYTEDLTVRASYVETTQLCGSVSEIHSSFPIATILLGRLLTGATLLASQLWEGQSLSLRVESNGPIGQLYAESSYEGKVRAYVTHPHLDLPPNAEGHFDLKGAVGGGLLVVNRNVPFQRHPQMGIVPIVCGEISKDLAFYLEQSQQTPSVVSLTVTLDSSGKVIASGGVLLEVIAGAPESIIGELERKTSLAPPLSKMILDKRTPKEIVSQYTHSTQLKDVDHPYFLSYSCRCSIQRVEHTLSLMGRGTLSEMVLKGEAVQVKCEFCGKQYEVEINQVRQLLNSLEA